MMKTIEALNACISPVSTARVFNPMRSEYYLKDNSPAPTASSQAVKVTLSAEAQAAIKTS
jgi:hypothetical protein